MLERDLGPLHLTLLPDPAGNVEVLVSFPGWSGSAFFPAPVADEALLEFSDIETPNDLEDLFRPWADEETWAAYQELRNREGF